MGYIKQLQKQRKYLKITLNIKKSKHSNPYLFLNTTNQSNSLPSKVLDIYLNRYLSKSTSYKIRAFRLQRSYYKTKIKKIKVNKFVNSKFFRVNTLFNNPFRFSKTKKNIN